MESKIPLRLFVRKSPTSSKNSRTKASNAIQKSGTNGFSNIRRQKKPRRKHRVRIGRLENHINREETGRRESAYPFLFAVFSKIVGLIETHYCKYVCQKDTYLLRTSLFLLSLFLFFFYEFFFFFLVFVFDNID